jgi:nitroreductase
MKHKEADNQYPIHELLKKRWSPRAFDEKPVEKEKIQSILEAARWAPSSMNQQPWRFIVGIQPDETFHKILETLVSLNQLWAKSVPVLIATFGRKFMNNSEKNNLSYQYDVGQAVAHLSIEAMNQGLYVHQMSDFEPKQMVDAFDVPFEYKPLTVVAVGYMGDVDKLHPRMQADEKKRRERFETKDLVYNLIFGQPTNLFIK